MLIESTPPAATARALPLLNTRESYGLVHQVLHWTTALLILFMLPLGLVMHWLPATAEWIDLKVWLYSLHKSVGVVVVPLAVARILWAVWQPHPNLLHGGWEAFAAKTVHWLLYFSILAVPVTGWLQHAALDGYAPLWWGWGDTLPLVPKSAEVASLFATAHGVLTKVLAAALVLHIGGALKHAVLDRDRTLARMVPGAYHRSGTAPAPKGFVASSFAAAAMVAVLAVGLVGAVHTLGGERDLGLVADAAAPAPTADAATAPVSAIAPDAATAPVAAAPTGAAWAIDGERSALEIEVTQLGSPVRGRFDTWRADVTFDPDRPEASTIDAEVTIGSLSLSDVSERAIGDEFLRAAANPVARFRSEEVVRTEQGFEARGTLSLAGTERPFTLPFTFREEGGRGLVDAEATIQRLDFGVGEGFADDSSVGRAVRLLLTIEAERPGAAGGEPAG